MLGTVGSENRMDGTALLISQETYAHLSNIFQYAIRTIDRVKVKGKSECLESGT